MNKITWKDKYLLVLNENLTTKEIQLLTNLCYQKSLDIRNKAIDYCIENNLFIYNRSVPTEAVLSVINHDIDYYYNKMLLENKANILACEGI